MSTDNMDDFFESLFGYRPKKRGRGFEMLVAAALKLAGHDRVHLDQHLRGSKSGTSYQADGVTAHADKKGMVEVKDYAERNEPVGRSDLQKLAGALIDLDEIDEGMIASATGFTGPSKKYAEATSQGLAKPIRLLTVRPSITTDDDGRIKRIILTLTIRSPDFSRASWGSSLTEEGKRLARKVFGGESLPVGMTAFFNADGSIFQTVRDFTLELTKRGAGTDTKMGGKHVFPDGVYVKAGTTLLPIAEVVYEIPYQSTITVVTIESTGTPRVLVMSEDRSIDKLITDDELARVHFDESGEVHIEDAPIATQ